MRFGVFASLLFHLAILGAAFVSLPPSWRPDVEAEPYIPLELIAEAELDLTTSVPAAAPEPIVEEESEPDIPEPIIEEEPALEPEPVAAEPEPEPEPEPVVVAAAEPETPEPTPPKKQPSVKPQRTAELDLDALSKLVDKSRDDSAATAREAPSQTAEAADNARRKVGAGDRLTASDEAKMRAAVERCWNAGAIIGAPNPETLIVTIDIALDRDGSLASPPKVMNQLQINLSGNRFWKVAEQSALRAVVACAPYDFLPQDRYETWREFTLNFDPSQMAGM
ncbi:MAG: cell envelope integrity protein TolA [Alphaproteobacteria bacterium]|nr:cell envelope integrity protein TolA [Alphaproteobacteria bacterium]